MDMQSRNMKDSQHIEVSETIYGTGDRTANPNILVTCVFSASPSSTTGIISLKTILDGPNINMIIRPANFNFDFHHQSGQYGAPRLDLQYV